MNAPTEYTYIPGKPMPGKRTIESPAYRAVRERKVRAAIVAALAAGATAREALAIVDGEGEEQGDGEAN